jgi:hypothetical protein
MKPIFNTRDLAATQGIMAAFFFLLIPVFNLFGLSTHKLDSILHGLGATLTVIISCFVLHALFPFLRGKEGSVKKLELSLWITNILILLTIIIGNWLYMGYRAPDGAQQWFLYNAPLGHLVMMEFKEFTSLFPLPLGVAGSFLLWRFKRDIETVKGVSSVIALLVTLMWLFLLLGFVFGIGITKLKIV